MKKKDQPIFNQSINSFTSKKNFIFLHTQQQQQHNTTAIKKKGYREKKSGFRLLLLLEDTHVFTRSCCTFLKENATDRPTDRCSIYSVVVAKRVGSRRRRVQPYRKEKWLLLRREEEEKTVNHQHHQRRQQQRIIIIQDGTCAPSRNEDERW